MKQRIRQWGQTLSRGVNLWSVLLVFFLLSAALVGWDTLLLFRLARGHVGEVCQAARGAYERGGSPALREVVRGAAAGHGVRVHLLDNGGRDLATGRSGAHLIRVVDDQEEPRPLVVRTAAYACVVEPPAARPALPPGPMWWVMPFVSALCCSVGIYVTWRMRRVEAAVRHFGAGELAARIPANSGDAIGRVACAFNQMAERIETLVASHQRLCADMAHELRSPLTRLMLAAGTLRGGARDAVECVEREAARIDDLITQLLEVARAEADPSALDREPVELGALLASIVEQCRIEAEEARCSVVLCAEGAGFVDGDAELLHRAVENVLRNAIRHAPAGTVVEVTAEGDLCEARVRVRDYGPGVPEPELASLFRPFYRVNGQAGCGGGTGLGLAIAQRAAALHQGSIFAVNCEPGLQILLRIPRS